MAALILALLMLTAAQTNSPHVRPSAPPLSGEVVVQPDASVPTKLNVTLTSRGPCAVAVSPSALPWETRWAFVLVATPFPFDEPLKPSPAPIEDPSPASLVLRPGEPVNGTINLESRFPTIKKALSDKGRDGLLELPS